MKNLLSKIFRDFCHQRLVLFVCAIIVVAQLGIFLVTPVSATNYYISPSGNDTNNGLTEDAPFATFVQSYKALVGGDTLILLDGNYNQQLSPRISGSAGNPITFRAKNRGKAVIQMTSNGSAIELYSTVASNPLGLFISQYITIDGLIARSMGEYPAINVASDDKAIEAGMTNNIIIKNTGAFGSCSLTNCVVWSIGNNARDCLFEDVFSYGFGRKAMQAFGAMRITIRRAVLRYDYWAGTSYKPNDPRVTFSGYNTIDSVFENMIAIDSAPGPVGTSSDRASFVSSGNLTDVAVVTHSQRNKYRGLLALNSYGNGVEIHGGSGPTPNEGITFNDIIVWKPLGPAYGFNVADNDNGAVADHVTVGYAVATGFRVNPNPSSVYGIHNEIITHSFSTHNGGYGFYYTPSMVATFSNNTSTFNNDSDREPSYAPAMNYLVKPMMVTGHERGAMMVNRYVDGVLTGTPLWPWPNEDLIKQHMCNPTDLAVAHRVASNGKDWEPAWCASSKTLTKYIWEYLGNPIPTEIYSATPQIIDINIK